MRQIFSVRFFAAVGAVVALFLLLITIFVTRDAIDDGSPDEAPPAIHPIDLVEQVYGSRNPSFRLRPNGEAAADAELVIDGQRSLQIVAGTPGVDHCPQLGEIGACAVVADLLGEGVIWFALVPMGSKGPSRTVEFPAIDVLDDGMAILVNGWQVPYAPILDRRCGDEEFASYREFRDELGDDFTSIYSLDERRIVAVECRTKVPYAPGDSEQVEREPVEREPVVRELS